SQRGKIGIFNRSYYEEVLVVRVHQDLLNAQQLPKELVSKNIWEERYEDINNFEQYLVRNGVIVMKFFLHLSKGEQKKRFLERLEMPEKNWKFSMADVKERSYWKDYQKAYEEMIQNTASKHAPWHVVPADNKWFSRLAVAGAIIHKLHSLDLQFPEVDDEKKKELAKRCSPARNSSKARPVVKCRLTNSRRLSHMNHVAAVIGAGFVGRAHIEALRRIPVRVKGTLVSSGDRTSAAAKALGLERAYTSLAQ